MSYIRDFTSVTVNQNESVVQINAGESNFSVKENSQLFIEGYTVPVTVLESDSNARTLTLTKPWPHANVDGVAARVIPLGDPDTYLSAVEANRLAYQTLIDSIDNPAGPLQAAIEQAIVYLNTQVAESPPVRQNPSLTHILSDYPTLKKTEVLPEDSPNNEPQIRYDDVRGLVHISLTDRWITIPTVIGSRKFAIFQRGTIIRLNSAYSGDIKLRVYPMGAGGNGLPNNPTLTNHQWHEYETTILEEDPLYKIGEFNSEYFEGIIDYIELDNSWATLDADRSYYRSLNGYFDVAFGTLKSPFRTFYQKADGYWYSEDITPQTPNYMGLSWTQDSNNFRNYSVNNAEGSTDALRFFGDDYDDYSFEIILVVHSINRDMAITISNSAPNVVYAAEPYRFLTNAERIYFKRRNNGITGSMTVESIKIRIPVSEY
ncbi:hypothetical protein KUL113_03540 [Tenacibaculum sp. KUL113]|nr:hypothetical protein KUL113_03540 [Tenacibaculum sp. KUL113]